MTDLSARSLLKRSVIRHRKRSKTLMVGDTTLRDGEQTPGVSLVPQQKLHIARQLAKLGVHSIDAGFPACGSSEVEAVRLVGEQVRGPVITALARALPSDIDLVADALCATPPHKRSVSIFIATSPLHREYKLHSSATDVLRRIADAVGHARRFFDVIAFAAEDASRTEPAFLVKAYETAIDAGATTIGFADTVGILTPTKAVEYVRMVQDNVSNLDRALLGVHFHNDLGLATANALACVEAGVDVVQCTVNGLGERAGNTPLEELTMAIHLHPDQYPVHLQIDTKRLSAVSRLVAKLTGVPVSPTKAVVGSNIFATEAGIHQDGILKHVDTYVPFRPEVIGASGVDLVLGKHSGRHLVGERLKALGMALTTEQLNRVFALFKQLCDCKRKVTEQDLLALARSLEPAPR